ncbi:hypothetical protein [uncultured Methylovirgula sp.]|uniref:hypothetical protein n=1 Tax=uncultured Methylovirgula sp. TaxID=1285960 RepID=UPI002633759C|nr:hypothetical protein [uncultured Methylovirgula sp.]
MRTANFALGIFCAAALLGLPPAEAKPGGCLKYGAAGAIAGHYAGHHAFKGAVAGCLAGMARRHAYNNEVAREKAEAAHRKTEGPGGAPADNPAASGSTQDQK